jgi:hypothetical protein
MGFLSSASLLAVLLAYHMLKLPSTPLMRKPELFNSRVVEHSLPHEARQTVLGKTTMRTHTVYYQQREVGA